MASSPSLWYGNYRGAVYPIDLHAAPTDLGTRVRHVKTLVELCAEKIVQDSDMTRHAISIIPKPLCEPLMKVGGEEQSHAACSTSDCLHAQNLTVQAQ